MYHKLFLSFITILFLLKIEGVASKGFIVSYAINQVNLTLNSDSNLPDSYFTNRTRLFTDDNTSIVFKYVDLDPINKTTHQISIDFQDNPKIPFYGTINVYPGGGLPYTVYLFEPPNPLNQTQVENNVTIGMNFNMGSSLRSIYVTKDYTPIPFTLFNNNWTIVIEVPCNITVNDIILEFYSNKVISRDVLLTLLLEPSLIDDPSNHVRIPVAGNYTLSLRGCFLSTLNNNNNNNSSIIRFTNENQTLDCSNLNIITSDKLECNIQSGSGSYKYNYTFISTNTISNNNNSYDNNNTIILSYEEPSISSTILESGGVLSTNGTGFNEPIIVTINDNKTCSLPTISNFTNIKCNTQVTVLYKLRVDVANQWVEYQKDESHSSNNPPTSSSTGNSNSGSENSSVSSSVIIKPSDWNFLLPLFLFLCFLQQQQRS
ncbi:hypothetical protein PPL_01662 [Heterostelium album PN500]|uniref:Uncharacterized protein n=1 Tax=Heterostelium pallidum (strain ATCC 26659 / Pp 5 / PN500) TaxID=670386 RepID=D3B048_HETP5|nr:hypothetical protein PPL_01662 [Heterostelium album PN500]EFA84672.1 hypothetical protein PPL_01662 [Heterostelium album PN500]|eukprot:XP_020436785.1 hypothetical protein PPL_01662 [Heterostelium album PN500]